MNAIEKIKALPYMSMRLNALADWLEAGGAGIGFNYLYPCYCVAGNIKCSGAETPQGYGSDVIEDVVGNLRIDREWDRTEIDPWDESWYPETVSEFIYYGYAASVSNPLGVPSRDDDQRKYDRGHAARVIRALARRIEVFLRDLEEDAAIVKVEAPEAEWEAVEV